MFLFDTVEELIEEEDVIETEFGYIPEDRSGLTELFDLKSISNLGVLILKFKTIININPVMFVTEEDISNALAFA